MTYNAIPLLCDDFGVVSLFKIKFCPGNINENRSRQKIVLH